MFDRTTPKTLAFSFLVCVLSLVRAGGEPTGMREWTSSMGTTMEAVALERDGDEIVFERGGGKKLRIKLGQLSESDQEFLKKHFPDQAGGSGTSRKAPPEDLPHPQGEVVGPLEAGDSHYFLYLPKSLVAGRPAPLLFFTGAGGGNRGSVERHVKAAEAIGWIVASSVESKNGMNGEPHVRACLEEITNTLPVDPKRFYFTGGSGGGQRALFNTETFDGAGGIPIIVHGVMDNKPSTGRHFYYIGGANDYNRYGTAALRAHAGKNAFHRFHPLGHNIGPAEHAQDGMIWLQGRFLAEKSGDQAFAEERADYEVSILGWLEVMKDWRAYRAMMLLDFLIEDYGISRDNEARADKLRTTLSADPANLAYAQAIKDLDKLSKDTLAGLGVGSRHKHNSKDASREAARLMKKYEGIPEIPEILTNLQKQTK